MQYQCTYNEIEKGICYALTTKPNTKFTSSEILNIIIENKICPELCNKYHTREFQTEFEEKCNNASKKSQKLKKNGNCYYFSTKDPIDIEFLKTVVMSPNNYPTIKFDSDYEEGETILHILCSNGLHEYVKKISELINIDPRMKNSLGQTLFDVVPFTINGHQTFKTLFNIFLTQELNKNELNLSQIKKTNVELLKTNKNIEMEKTQILDNLKEVKYNLNYYKFYSFLQLTIIFVLLSYIIHQSKH